MGSKHIRIPAACRHVGPPESLLRLLQDNNQTLIKKRLLWLGEHGPEHSSPPLTLSGKKHHNNPLRLQDAVDADADFSGLMRSGADHHKRQIKKPDVGTLHLGKENTETHCQMAVLERFHAHDLQL